MAHTELPARKSGSIPHSRSNYVEEKEIVNYVYRRNIRKTAKICLQSERDIFRKKYQCDRKWESPCY